MVQDEERARLGQANLSSKFHWEWMGLVTVQLPQKEQFGRGGKQYCGVHSTGFDIVVI